MSDHAHLILQLGDLRNEKAALQTELEVLDKEIEALRARYSKAESLVVRVRDVIWALERLQKVEANE